jgi:hypothetical protein
LTERRVDGDEEEADDGGHEEESAEAEENGHEQRSPHACSIDVSHR